MLATSFVALVADDFVKPGCKIDNGGLSRKMGKRA
tara:strand:- start:4775 stop:4879 length:105 start_codon:yes stop_codon:yes gene_type:complete